MGWDSARVYNRNIYIPLTRGYVLSIGMYLGTIVPRTTSYQVPVRSYRLPTSYRSCRYNIMYTSYLAYHYSFRSRVSLFFQISHIIILSDLAYHYSFRSRVSFFFQISRIIIPSDLAYHYSYHMYRSRSQFSASF